MNDETQIAELRRLFPVVEHWAYLYNGSIHACPKPVGELALRYFKLLAEAGCITLQRSNVTTLER